MNGWHESYNDFPGPDVVCGHLQTIAVRPGPDPAAACVDCLRDGTSWVELRRLVCGQTRCCESSPRRHAREHFDRTGHAWWRSRRRSSNSARPKSTQSCGSPNGSPLSMALSRRLCHGHVQLRSSPTSRPPLIADAWASVATRRNPQERQMSASSPLAASAVAVSMTIRFRPGPAPRGLLARRPVSQCSRRMA